MERRLAWVTLACAAVAAGVLLLRSRVTGPERVPKPVAAPSLVPERKAEAAKEPVAAASPMTSAPRDSASERRTEGARPSPAATHPQAAVRPPEVSRMARFREVVAGLDLSPGVRVIVGLDAAKDYGGRVTALRGLTRRIAGDDVKALRLFLRLRPEDQPGLEPIELNSVKNDVLEILMQQEAPPEGLGLQMVEMWRDPGSDEMWRDYCVQLMGTYYGATGLWEESRREDPERKAIEAAYAEALAERDKPAAGTALLGMARLSREHGVLDTGGIARAAVEMSADDRCPQGARITALRVCGMMGATDALPPARMLAQTGEIVPLQMAAIATLGEIGEAGDAELLASLSAGSDRRTAATARAARQALERRMAAGAGK